MARGEVSLIEAVKPYRWLFVALVAIGLAGALAILRATDGRLPAGLVSETEIPVQVAHAVKYSLPEVVRVPGQLRAASEVEVVSRLAGRVTRVNYGIGDWVPKGAVIATIHSTELIARVITLEGAANSAQADVREQEGQLAESERQLEKMRELHNLDLIPRRDLDQARTRVETANVQLSLARARVAEREAMLSQGRQLLSLSRVIAPTSGIVTHRQSDPGHTVASSSPILTIANVDTLKVTMKSRPETFPRVVTGTLVEVRAETPAPISLEGTVVALDKHDKSGEVVAEMEIEIPNWHRKLQVGAAVTVSVTGPTQNDLVVIPSSALSETNDKDYVFRVVDGRALKTEVIVVKRQDGKLAIKGLTSGDSVVVDPPISLQSNSRVRT